MKKLLLLFLLTFSFLSCSSSQDIPIVRIGLFKLDEGEEIILSQIKNVVNSYVNAEVIGNGNLKVKVEEDNVLLDFGEDVLILTLPVIFYPKEERIGINFNYYRGILEINKEKWVINILNLEDYLLGVVPAEMSISYPMEALKAQAIASRTYALANMGKHKIFDLCASVHCQVYKGLSYEKEKSNIAVRETQGEVIIYNGSLINAYYHSSSGGITENSEDVWGGYSPYLRSVKDVEELEKDTWTLSFSLEDVRAKLNGIGISFQDIFSIEFEKSSTGRIKNVIIKSSDKNFIIKGTLWREIFNLPSTLFNVEFKNEKFYLYGRGMGHGVGLSQKGAKFLAERGYNYKDIIKFYYQGVEIKKWY